MALRCPRCGAPVLRIPRRPIDRLVSLVHPVKRYRCRAHGCLWTGSIGRGRAAELAMPGRPVISETVRRDR